MTTEKRYRNHISQMHFHHLAHVFLFTQDPSSQEMRHARRAILNIVFGHLSSVVQMLGTLKKKYLRSTNGN